MNAYWNDIHEQCTAILKANFTGDEYGDLLNILRADLVERVIQDGAEHGAKKSAVRFLEIWGLNMTDVVQEISFDYEFTRRWAWANRR